MILPHDAWGNALPRPEDRIKRLSRMVTPAPDARDAEIAALKARVTELELALKMALSASATVSPSATPEKIKTAPDIIAAKSTVADEPWTALGISRRTYYRRKAAGVI